MTTGSTSCRHCGFGIPEDAPTCGGCGRPGIENWRALRKSVPRERHARQQSLRDEGFRPMVVRCFVARSTITVAIAVIAADVAVHAARAWSGDTRRIEIAERTFILDDVAYATTAATLVTVAIALLLVVAWSRSLRGNWPILRMEAPRLIRAGRWAGSFLAPSLFILGWGVAGALDKVDRTAQSIAQIVGALVLASSTSALRRLMADVTLYQARRADRVVDIRAQEARLDAMSERQVRPRKPGSVGADSTVCGDA